MSKRDLKLLLEDIQEATQKIQKYTKEYSFEDFMADDKTVDAVVRNFEIVGEVSLKLDIDYKNKNPQIQWKGMKNLRNRIIHDYTGIDYEIVWEIIKNYIEELEFQIANLIKEIQ
jgi:uncharacterized protein with HEPN domain